MQREQQSAFNYVVVTGVSSGIGLATTSELIRHGYHVFGSVRRAADGQRVSEQLAAEQGTQAASAFTPLYFDTTDEPAVQAAAATVAATIGEQGLAGLVNNAGVTIPGPLQHMPLDEFRRQLEVNLVGTLAVTQAFLPLLGAQQAAPFPPGRIINISSISGRIAYPFMGAYAASKHGLEALSDALRRELLPYGIDVVVIQPGTTQTPIIEKFATQTAGYAATAYGPILAHLDAQVAQRRRSAIPVERVSQTVRLALEAKRPKTRYVLPRKRLTGWLLPRWLPDRWFDRLVGRQLLQKWGGG
jgi:NAD(P)-dependent dehydrogenase (short-subunit alcohol dehydrogenase family)